MKRPKITLDNERAVYEYFENKKPNVPLMRAFHAVMGVAYHPRIEYEEGAQQEIFRQVQDRRQLFLTANHVLWHDQNVIASVVQRERVFHPLRGNIIVPGKVPIFNTPVIGTIATHGGAVPVFKRKYEKEGDSNEARLEAGKKVVGIVKAKLDQGYHALILPEGERNPHDPTRLLTLRDGIGRMACSAERPENISIVNIGMYYGEDNENRFTPNVFVGFPTEVAESPDLVLDSVRSGLQYSVNRAVAAGR